MAEAALGLIISALSSVLQASRVEVTLRIKNNHSSIKLMNSRQYVDGGYLSDKLAHEIEPQDETEANFKVNTSRISFEGALMYELKHIESDKPKKVNIYMLIAWKVTAFRTARVYMVLMENSCKANNWDAARLKKQHQEYRDLFEKHEDNIIKSWKLEDGTEFAVILSVAGQGTFGLNVDIMEGAEYSEYSTQPEWIEAEE
jgi:hypothetical protein